MPETSPTKTYFDNLSEGRFVIQRSRSTGEWIFYPRMMAPGSGAIDLEWVEPSGLATVYAATITRKKPPEASVSLAIVELDEGPRMMSQLRDIEPEKVKIGMRVRARIDDHPDGKLLVFVPEAGQ